MADANDRSAVLEIWQNSFNDRDWDAHCALYAEDVVWTIRPGTTMLSGQAETRNALEGFTARYPDIQLTVRRNITDGDLTAVEWDEIGTEAGSGDAAVFNFCGMIAFEDGLISSVARFGGRQP